MTESCKNCRFGHVATFEIEDRIDAYTACRFNPPEFVPPSSSQLKPVAHDGWCGKWQSKEIQPAALPAPRSDPSAVLFSKPSIRTKRKNTIKPTP